MRCLRCKQEIDRTFRACPHCGESVTEFARRFTDELLDGKYRIVERLGTGGMGEVYKAEHTFLGAMRVIKIIRPQISDNEDAHERFLREARLATKVQHTNVATLHDFSALPDGSHYMVWEYIDGENLAQRVRARGPLPPRAAVRLILQALHGLDAIHRAGIVHRDISPENLMITRDDVVKIIDLGVAKIEDPNEVSATRTGIFVGKLRYASPEQLGFIEEGEKVDARTDLYAIGMVLYETLAGRPPFEATSPHQYYMLHSEEREFRPIELQPDLPGGSELQQAIRRSLQRDRNKRFSTAREFIEALALVERSLPDPGAMKTMAVPLDGDATTRVPTERDTLHRTTVRTDSGSPPPAFAAPEPTIMTPRGRGAAPSPPPPPPPPAAITQVSAPASSKAPFIIIGLVLLLFVGALAAGGAWWLMRTRTPETADTTTTAPATTDTSASTPPPQSTIDVAGTTDSSGTMTTAEPPAVAEPAPEPTTSASVLTPAPRPTPAAPSPRPQPAPEEVEPEPEEAPETPALIEASSATTYIEHGDEDANERHLSKLRQELSGTTRIAVRGGAMQSELEAAIRDEYSHVEIVDQAPVVVEFEGQLTREGRGRKTRYAHAVVRKNGRVVFRYLLPKESYRVGDTPVEAFMRRLGDGLSE